MRSPLRAPIEDATSTAVGVARPSAHGHATTRTSTASRILRRSPADASESSVSPPVIADGQGMNERKEGSVDDATAADMAAQDVMGSVNSLTCGMMKVWI